jgi:hypothetical protein
MLNVALGVGNGGGAPGLSGWPPGSGRLETDAAIAFSIPAALFASPTIRGVAFARPSAAPDAVRVNAPRLFPTLRVLALFEWACPLPRTRLI